MSLFFNMIALLEWTLFVSIEKKATAARRCIFCIIADIDKKHQSILKKRTHDPINHSRIAKCQECNKSFRMLWMHFFVVILELVFSIFDYYIPAFALFKKTWSLFFRTLAYQ